MVGWNDSKDVGVTDYMDPGTFFCSIGRQLAEFDRTWDKEGGRSMIEQKPVWQAQG